MGQSEGLAELKAPPSECSSPFLGKELAGYIGQELAAEVGSKPDSPTPLVARMAAGVKDQMFSPTEFPSPTGEFTPDPAAAMLPPPPPSTPTCISGQATPKGGTVSGTVSGTWPVPDSSAPGTRSASGIHSVPPDANWA